MAAWQASSGFQFVILPVHEYKFDFSFVRHYISLHIYVQGIVIFNLS